MRQQVRENMVKSFMRNDLLRGVTKLFLVICPSTELLTVYLYWYALFSSKVLWENRCHEVYKFGIPPREHDNKQRG